MSVKYTTQIPRSVSIGYGLLIPHLVGIVVNSTTQIGSNCTLGHNVTVGSTRKRAARIGDNVYVGPHCCIVESVSIGSGSTLGAGAIVVHDVEPGVTVAGNPAAQVSVKPAGRLIKNPWPVAA